MIIQLHQFYCLEQDLYNCLKLSWRRRFEGGEIGCKLAV